MNANAAVLSGHTFLTTLVTNHHLFADEVDKFQFLRSLKKTLSNSGCSGISFVLTDGALRLVLYSETEDVRPDELILTGFHQVFLPYYAGRHAKAPCVQAQADAVPLHGYQQLLHETVNLHLLPKREGIVEWAADYWWCTAQTYLGHYSWDFINPDLLLSPISTDTQKARKELTRYARAAYQQEFGETFGYSR